MLAAAKVIMFNSGPPETLQQPASRRDL